MSTTEQMEIAGFIYNNLRLRTQPVAAKFLSKPIFPEKTKRPSKVLGKKTTVCQGVTMARVYSWTVGLTKDDLVCVPAMISFGMSNVESQANTIGNLYCDVTFSKDRETGIHEADSMSFLPNGKYNGILLAPMSTAQFEADVSLIYGNPAQINRLIQAWVYTTGTRLSGNFGSKIECTEYLIAPFNKGVANVSIPGNGDRIFSMTQDDEMVFSLPTAGLGQLYEGLKLAGKKLGAKYPITFYQNYQPEFPDYYKDLAKKLGLD